MSEPEDSNINTNKFSIYKGIDDETIKQIEEGTYEYNLDDPRDVHIAKLRRKQYEEEQKELHPTTIKKLHMIFKKWLSANKETLQNFDVALAVACEREIEGPPIWIFLMADSGGTKTEIIRALDLLPQYSQCRYRHKGRTHIGVQNQR